MLCDFHIHTDFSADSKSPARDQIEAAIRLGMKEICITDHHDYGTGHMCHLDYTLDPVTYFASLRELADEYREKIHVRSGIELGLMIREKKIPQRSCQNHSRRFYHWFKPFYRRI